MMQLETPTSRAYRRLALLARDEGYSDPRMFALSWLAAARMVVTGRVPSMHLLATLAEPSAWDRLLEAGFPPEALDVIGGSRSKTSFDFSRRAGAVSVVSELGSELGEGRWDVLPALANSPGRRATEADWTIVPELATLLMDLLGDADTSELWVPFDATGQLTVEALRRGWSVLAASPLALTPLMRQLLLTIEGGHPNHPKVRTSGERNEDGRPIAKARHALVMPPFGVPVKESRMASWDSTGWGFEQFSKSEVWAVAEFLYRVDERVVFVVPQGVLFAKGQEQRLREMVLDRRNQKNRLDAVLSLPPGVFGGAGIAGGLLVFSPGDPGAPIYMADLGIGRRSISEAGQIVAAGHDLALSRSNTEKSALVTRSEIAANEYSFAPSRYLRRVVDLGTKTAKLGEICEALRPPTPHKEPSGFEVAEVGMQDLNRWRPLGQPSEKTVFLKTPPKQTQLVRSGDVVLSIKGTVGKAALIGEAAQLRPTVPSQSCLSLRVDEQKVRPEFLLMYLRSPHGQAQLAGLQVGAGVQHISPSTLLSGFVVPLPSLEEQVAAVRDFNRLCQLEGEAARIEQEMNQVVGARWPEESV